MPGIHTGMAPGNMQEKSCSTGYRWMSVSHSRGDEPDRILQEQDTDDVVPTSVGMNNIDSSYCFTRAIACRGNGGRQPPGNDSHLRKADPV